MRYYICLGGKERRCVMTVGTFIREMLHLGNTVEFSQTGFCVNVVSVKNSLGVECARGTSTLSIDGACDGAHRVMYPARRAESKKKK